MRESIEIDESSERVYLKSFINVANIIMYTISNFQVTMYIFKFISTILINLELICFFFRSFFLNILICTYKF